MMLDSSLGKILSTKTVEPSLATNSEVSQTKEGTIIDATKSEAEVRIVFRFFVEEQIVFNGKIERIKQLESEELSRIVSRIAWNDANEGKQPILDKEIIKNDKIKDIPKDKAQPDNLCNPTNVSPSSDDSKSGERREDTSEKVSDKNCSNTNSHEKNLTSVFPEEDKILVIEKLPLTDEINSYETQKSDNCTTAPYSNHICETIIQTNSSYQVQEYDKQQSICVEDPQRLDQLSNFDSSSRIEEFDAAAESQMIVEALYDCVYNVDLESRKSDLESTVNVQSFSQNTTKKIHLDELINSSVAPKIKKEKNVDIIKEVTKLDKKPLTEAANVPPNNDTTHEAKTEERFFEEKSLQLHQVCKDDLSLKTIPSKKSDIDITTRRRNTCDSSLTNRRIRRVVKDQRASRVSIGEKHGENNRLDGSIDIETSGGLFTRQSKVFAKWSDNHFYPGTILKPSRDRKFEIGFFDGARKDVVETDLIPLSNILRKQVRVSIAKDYCVNAIVHEQLLHNNQPMFDVEYQQNGLVRKCVPLRDIFLTAEQGIPLINQPIRPDKNPDESMFAGVDLDNIVHNKRSRRLQELEDLEAAEENPSHSSNILANGGRRKRGQYNMRTTTNRARTNIIKTEVSNERGLKRSHSDINNRDTPISSCSPDNLKTQLHSSNSNPPSECSSSTGSSNSASNAHEMGQEFYFDSTSPHRTKTSLLL